MGWLEEVKEGEIAVRPLKVLLYGVEGVGKSSWAMGAPNPIFLDGARGTWGLPVKRIDLPSWPALLSTLQELLTKGHSYQTVVIDLIDDFERMLVKHVCQINGNAASIEAVGGGFGKGWTAVAEEWDKVIQALEKIQEQRGMHVIALGHADPNRFSDPDGADYNRWTLRVSKKTANLWKGWVEELLFATRDVSSGKYDKGKGKGGERVLFTEWSPGRECKNRHNLPEKLRLNYADFDRALQGNASRVVKRNQAEEPREEQGAQQEEQRAAPTGIADLVRACEGRASTLLELGLKTEHDKALAWVEANRETGRGLAQLLERMNSAIAEAMRADEEAAAEAEAEALANAQEEELLDDGEPDREPVGAADDGFVDLPF